jgi:recombination protein RecT
MPKSEIEKRKSRSKAASSKFSPWHTDYEEMAKKTVVRHMWKYLPISVEIQQQVAYDEGTARSIKDITPNDDVFLEAPNDIIDIEEQEENKSSEQPADSEQTEVIFDDVQ